MFVISCYNSNRKLAQSQWKVIAYQPDGQKLNRIAVLVWPRVWHNENSQTLTTEVQKGATTLGKNLPLASKVKVSIYPPTQQWSFYTCFLKKIMHRYTRNTHGMNFTAALFVILNYWKHPKSPVRVDWREVMW